MRRTHGSGRFRRWRRLVRRAVAPPPRRRSRPWALAGGGKPHGAGGGAARPKEGAPRPRHLCGAAAPGCPAGGKGWVCARPARGGVGWRSQGGGTAGILPSGRQRCAEPQAACAKRRVGVATRAGRAPHRPVVSCAVAWTRMVMERVLGVARTACRGRPWATPPPAAMREAVRSAAASGRRTTVTEPSPAVEADATAGTYGGAGGDRGGCGRIHDAASVGCAAAQTAIAGVAPAAGGRPRCAAASGGWPRRPRRRGTRTLAVLIPPNVTARWTRRAGYACLPGPERRGRHDPGEPPVGGAHRATVPVLVPAIASKRWPVALSSGRGMGQAPSRKGEDRPPYTGAAAEHGPVARAHATASAAADDSYTGHGRTC